VLLVVLKLGLGGNVGVELFVGSTVLVVDKDDFPFS
jgi:hypothetical protein